MNRCTWTENIKKERPNYIGITSFQEQCENMTEEQFDEYGRVYCKEHRIKVDEINKSRHKNCINKEKLINFLKEQIQDELDKGDNGIPYIEALDLIKDLENGDFD
ncbi:hypothetical protein [Spiroplasma endosymbiont of Phycita roborella]|uniref:hypothetical protein n=1 Tax=Spiroplasma endosymbiont of Phycita roborella TaxID=3066311 RepID=UPI00313BBF05